ncbi:uncharacterized protein FPRO_01639 [Fusarium proliferatum ET1]|uniref:Uncharacterized protein n=1 Tax=Fusarium proliferatum (strain ET1) TaxID=1227346 RepID=A0A1L7V4R9_FUSPR|nr:uncharacterized protein FPRO_01639 [Fusarium proliferatum ET1]CZR33666.1 uncharacterized protein FPRO_01639 [Fusarium proliferatum ET1]
MGTVLHRVPLEKAIFILAVLQLHLHHDSFVDFLHVRNVNPPAGDQASPPLWIPFKQSELELLADETVAALVTMYIAYCLKRDGSFERPAPSGGSRAIQQYRLVCLCWLDFTLTTTLQRIIEQHEYAV